MRSTGVYALAHGGVDPKSLGQEQKEYNIYGSRILSYFVGE
jgi:hypothetical protein